MFLLKDTTQWRRWSSNPGPFGLESSTLPLSHCAQGLVEDYDKNSQEYALLLAIGIEIVHLHGTKYIAPIVEPRTKKTTLSMIINF